MTRILAAASLALLVGCASGSGGPAGQGAGGSGGFASGGSGGSGGTAEVVPTEVKVFDAVRINSHTEEANFQTATADVTFGAGPYFEVRLIVDLASSCFPWEQWQSDPPPQGQNWPPHCDAFDRNFEFVLDPPAKDGDPPGLELARSITPFGGPMHYEVDITDVAAALPGMHRLVVTIPTYSDNGTVTGSDGGWKVSATLRFTPGRAPHHVLAAIPLWNGTVGPGTGPGVVAPDPVSFTLPAGTTHTRLEYRVTGHGGGDASTDPDCIGPAEEFCKRTHVLSMDDHALATEMPWRDDCSKFCKMVQGGPFGSYCEKDPCGLPASVRASRANWCPGDFTPPFTYDDPVTSPGPHHFSWTVSKILPGGGVRTSAVIFAYGE
jgi:hypothetical protein